ncbi:MAG: family 78 glycoside hydrolase catalytic domain [Armatimonadetes bacterium]|nr:family 78 glycoside hydrolase catalytic domain [Armatimonadota bacterium]
MGSWNARWISWSQHPDGDLGAYLFRREFEAKPGQSLAVKVTADQRYRLLLNGEAVGEGPQRGDGMHWFYETYDLAPQLRAGKNVLEAVVWSYGRYAPMAQMGHRLAFLLQGDGVSTPDGWKVARIAGRAFEMLHSEVGPFYIDIGPGETIDLRALEAQDWKDPNVVGHALERGEWAGDSPWNLIPRSIPAMRCELRTKPPMVVDRSTDDRNPFGSLMLHGGEKVLLDFGELVCGYPELSFEGPEGASVRVTYGEGLFDKGGNKGDRDKVKDKRILGYQDRFVVGRPPRDGGPAVQGLHAAEAGAEASVSTLWWRTWRYLQLESDAPVRLAKCSVRETGYPYRVESSFRADDPWVAKIWDVGVRTAMRCAGETYFDCPYYEQLQYAGDTRIQALVHSLLSRDRALPRNAVEQFAWSLLPEGLTQSRYPSRVTQVIPPFTLFWIQMVCDQRLYDTVQDRRLADVASSALLAVERWIKDGPEFWPFSDWVDDWPMGIAPGGRRSKLLEALFHWTSLTVKNMPPVDGRQNVTSGDSGSKLRHIDDVFVKEGGLRKSTSGGEWGPSEHLEAIVRLCQSAEGRRPDPWPTEALAQAKASQTTLYFSYYKHLAMAAASGPDFDYMSRLGPWKRMIEDGLTTFAEKEDPVRSDCHAWSAHPLLGFLQTVAGVTSSAVGWVEARIEPKPGRLKWFEADIAHPQGDLRVVYRDGRLDVDSPVPYTLVWKGRTDRRPAGKGRF